MPQFYADARAAARGAGAAGPAGPRRCSRSGCRRAPGGRCGWSCRSAATSAPARAGERNAALAYDARFNEDGAAHYDALETLRAALGLAALPRRIDCFDISTLQGSETVASMVVCEDGRMKPRSTASSASRPGHGTAGTGTAPRPRPRRSRTRARDPRARPRPAEARILDDFASMQEVVRRRYRRSPSEAGRGRT